MTEVRYAKEDVYAEVDEEGGKVNRLVAVAGQPVPPTLADYVDDSQTTKSPPDKREPAVAAGRSTASRRAEGQTVDEAEQRAAEFRGELEGEGKKSRRSSGRKARRASPNKARGQADSDK